MIRENGPEEVPRVVILGAGFAGIYTAINLSRKLRVGEGHILLIDCNNYHLFKPLIHEAATGAVEPNSIIQPIRKIMEGRFFDFREGMVQAQEDREKIMKALEENNQFQNDDKQLNGSGFRRGRPSFNQVFQNRTEISVPYQNGRGEERNITALYDNGQIKEVRLEGAPKAKSRWWPWALLLAAAVPAFWYLHRKFKRRDAPAPVPAKAPAPADIADEPRALLAEALFQGRRKKDACEKVSQAVRLYYCQKLGVNREITNQELLYALKDKQDYDKIKTCVESCACVEFARGTINKAGFTELISKAREVLN